MHTGAMDHYDFSFFSTLYHAVLFMYAQIFKIIVKFHENFTL